MMHRSTREVVDDLKRHGRLIEVDEPLSPNLEIAEVQRRVYQRGGPAILFTNPRDTRFPMVSNLFGSLDQARFLFRKTLDRVRRAIELKIDPHQLLANPSRYLTAPWTAWTMRPRMVPTGPVFHRTCELSGLPQLVSWPEDGGPFITLPQVLSLGGSQSLKDCNLGMYRVQLAGNDYAHNSQVGLHYQLHRGIGIHHTQAIAVGQPLQVAITVGGTPAMTLAAVMPLPEGVSELTFAGALAGHRIPMVASDQHVPIYADADFVIYGEVDLESLKPEGPFGDHLGYYSKQHPFPWLHVRGVSHRDGAIWPFTVVGRPPQEDTTFGQLIHELTGPIIPSVIPGVRAVHAVDAAGVHPLLLAIGSERYTPYTSSARPQELLTQANAILGQGQMSLAKYLLILDGNGAPELDIDNVQAFFHALLERIDWSRDLHFQTQTTIDTLDYSGDGLNRGSKVVWAATGKPRRQLATDLPLGFSLPSSFGEVRWCMPGVLAIQWRRKGSGDRSSDAVRQLLEHWNPRIGFDRDMQASWNRLPLVIVCDDVEFTARSLHNWLWVTFTRSNPAVDIDGVDASIEHKHWGCKGSLVIDATIKDHHAAPLVEEVQVTRRIDALAARGGPLARYL